MYLDLNNLRMFIAERSSASSSTLLFLHGFPLNHSMWRQQVQWFGASYHCLAPDLRGHGGTLDAGSPLTTDQVSIDLMADDLIAVLDQLLPRGKKVTVCGLSLGGYIAFALWRKAPQRFERLILADTKATPDTAEARERRAAQAELVRTNGPRAVSDGMLDVLLAPSNRDRAIGMEVRRMIKSSPSQGVINTLRALAQRPDSVPTLATINVPTLIVVGELDKLTPLSDAEAMYQQLPSHKTLTVIPAAGHLSPLENPDAFNRAMLGFLQ